VSNAIFGLGIFAVVGLLFLALFSVATNTPPDAPVSPVLWALAGAAGFCLVVMLLFFMAANS
jgi:hypothetical protein